MPGWSERRAGAAVALLLAGVLAAPGAAAGAPGAGAGAAAGAAPAGPQAPASKPPAPAPAPVPAPEAAPAPAGPRMQARVVVILLAGDEMTRRTFAYRKLGNKVRMEPAESGDPRFAPETLYDYDQRLSYRNLVDDQITFAYRLSLQERVLAQAEGFMSTPAEEPMYRLEVNPKVTFDGHPCTLVLTGFPSPDGRIHALRWVWEALDMDRQPVKVVFPRGDGTIEIVEFLDATAAPFDPALVSVPAGWPVMSGL